MLRRVIDWWKDSRQWRQDHVAAFSAIGVKDASGLTAFQNQCVEAVSTHVARASFEKATHQDGTLYLVAPLDSAGTKLFIYDTEAGIQGPSRDLRYEEWDFRTPAELISAVVGAVGALVPSNPTLERDARKSGARPSA